MAGIREVDLSAADLEPGNAQGRDRAAVRGMVRVRLCSESLDRVPDCVLPDRHQYRYGPELDRTGKDFPGAFDGIEWLQYLPPDPFSQRVAVDFRGSQDLDHAGRGRRGRRRICWRGLWLGIPVDGCQWRHEHAVAVCRRAGADRSWSRFVRHHRDNRTFCDAASRTRYRRCRDRLNSIAKLSLAGSNIRGRSRSPLSEGFTYAKRIAGPGQDQE